MIIAKVRGKCNISHFPREYVLVNATHPTLLMVPIFQQGELDSGFTAFNAGGLRHFINRRGGFQRQGYAAFVSIITN